MTTRQSEILDNALDKLQKDPGMGFAPNLQGDESAIALMVAAAGMVQALPALPDPDQTNARADREAFLARVEQLPAPTTPAETGGFLARLAQLLTSKPQSRTEPRPMVPVFVKVALLILVALISSLGGTAVLSAFALPDSPIYPVKLVLEEARLTLTADPAGQTTLHLAFAGERVQEMARLAAANQALEQAQLANFRVHWRQALLLAGEMPDAELLPLLRQAQGLVDEQETLLAQAQDGLPLPTQERLQEAENSLVQVQTAVQLGLQNQERYRWHMQHLPEDWPGVGYSFGFGPGDCEGDCESENGFAPAPGYGPGDGDEPGKDDPSQEEAGNMDPGNEDPGNEDPGNKDPGNEDPGHDTPGNDQPGVEIPGDDLPGKGDPGGEGPGNIDPGYDSPSNVDPGNDRPGNDQPGNDDPGQEDPGNSSPGNNQPGNTGPGSENPGNDDPGDESPGDSDPGSTAPGNDDPSDGDPGNTSPGDDDPGDGDPGNDDPGDESPGEGDPGESDPGNTSPGDDDPGDSDPGNEDPGHEDPGNDDPGNEDPGSDNPGGEDPGPGETGRK